MGWIEVELKLISNQPKLNKYIYINIKNKTLIFDIPTSEFSKL